MASIIFLVVTLFASAMAQGASQGIEAVVEIQPDQIKYKNMNVTGSLILKQMDPNGPVSVSGTIYNLSPGLHGFHVHQKGDMRGGCLSTGAHFNPKNLTHGAPNDAVRHVGDLGNVRADQSGVANVNATDSVISLTGPNSILGRGFVVHSMVDDLGKGNVPLSLTTGNAGDRVACGVVAVLSPLGSIPNSASICDAFMFMLFMPFTLWISHRA